MNYVVLVQVWNESITEVVHCLVDQIHQPYKIVIVDDGTPHKFVYEETYKLKEEFGENILYFRGNFKFEPNLDTVGVSLHMALLDLWEKNILFDYISIIDADSRPHSGYYELILNKMICDPNIYCASGIIQTNGQEKLTSAKIIRRKDARGSGKVIRVNGFLDKINPFNFPSVTWDTWINTKAKILGKKAIQLSGIYLYTKRPTTRLNKRDNFRDGKLTYHFGYNPLLVLYKILFRGRGFIRGYRDAKKDDWQLFDKQVRKWFGWRYLLRFWK